MRKETEIPDITEEQVAATQKIAGLWKPKADAKPRRCDQCRAKAVVQSDELSWEEVRGAVLLVVRRLSGERCQQCGSTWFDGPSFSLIEKYRQARPVANYEASISRVGGSAVGIYFPKDLQRVMEILPGQKAHITPVSESAMLMEIVPPESVRRRKSALHIVDESLGL